VSEVEKIDRAIKAVKMIVTNLQQKVGELTKTIHQHEEQMQTLIETTRTEPSISEDMDLERLNALDEKVKADTGRLDQLETGHSDLDTKLTALRGKLAEVEDTINVAETPAISSFDSRGLQPLYQCLSSSCSIGKGFHTA